MSSFPSTCHHENNQNWNVLSARSECRYSRHENSAPRCIGRVIQIRFPLSIIYASQLYLYTRFMDRMGSPTQCELTRRFSHRNMDVCYAFMTRTRHNNNNTSIIIISFFFSAYVPIVHTQKLVYGLLMFPVLMLYSYIIVLYQAVSQADSSQD